MSNYVPEPISPNVTLIRKFFTDEDRTAVINIHHDNGIFQIDCQRFARDRVRNEFEKYEKEGHLYGVGVNGLKEDRGIGSKRFCTHDLEFASFIDSILNQAGILQTTPHNGRMLEYAGCSQYWRLMKYESDGEHFPHYDSDFTWGLLNGKTCVTTHTVVAYFSDCNSGEFAFVKDKRNVGKTFNQSGFDSSDWSRQATEDEIIKKVMPKNGRILIFPHHMCHTVLPFTDEGGDRIIARGDLIFKEV